MTSTDATDQGSEGACLIEYTVNPAEPATHAVVEAVAAVSGADVEELPSLYDFVETEALDQLVAPRISEVPRDDVTVQFTYCGRIVTVSGKTITVRPTEE